MKKVIFLVFSIFILLILAFKTPLKTIKKGDCQLITNSKKNVAGSRVTIEFKTHSTIDIPQLFIKHSYGKTLVEGKYEKGKLIYRLPDFYSKKSGELSWFLFYEGDKKMEGNIEIVPNKNTETQIENYLGPRSILAGGSEFTMLVCVPTDAFDNPVIQNTTALIKSQFLDQIVISPKKTKDFIAWKNIYSSNQSGKILVSTEANAISSKEIETEVYANIATDFTISYKRNHVFADGNQVTTLITSTIKDQYNNIVTDGTMVNFIITNQKNILLRTYGTTINGIATGQILHPDHPDKYNIKAFVTGIAESKTISANYKPLISSFKYSFTNNNRTLIVGPIKSFMSQLIPDGIKVVVKVFHNNNLVTTLQEDTSRGVAKFNFSADFFKEKNYRFEIITLGIIQNTTTFNYGID